MLKMKSLKSLVVLMVIEFGLAIGMLMLSALFVKTVLSIGWSERLGEHRLFGTGCIIIGLLIGVGLGFRIWVSIDRKYFDGIGLKELMKSNEK